MGLLSPAKAKSFPSGRNLKHNGCLEGKLLLSGGKTSTTLASSRRHSQNLLKNHGTQPGRFWFLAPRIRPTLEILMIFEENFFKQLHLTLPCTKKTHLYHCIVKKDMESFEWFESNEIFKWQTKSGPSEGIVDLPKDLTGTVQRLTQQKPFGSGIKLLTGFKIGNSPWKIGASDQICYIYLLPCGWYQMKFGIYLSICLGVPMHSVPPSTERRVQKKKKICSARLVEKISYSTKVRNQRASFDLQRLLQHFFIQDTAPALGSPSSAMILDRGSWSQRRLDWKQSAMVLSFQRPRWGQIFWWSTKSV